MRECERGYGIDAMDIRETDDECLDAQDEVDDEQGGITEEVMEKRESRKVPKQSKRKGIR